MNIFKNWFSAGSNERSKEDMLRIESEREREAREQVSKSEFGEKEIIVQLLLMRKDIGDIRQDIGELKGSNRVLTRITVGTFLGIFMLILTVISGFVINFALARPGDESSDILGPIEPIVATSDDGPLSDLESQLRELIETQTELSHSFLLQLKEAGILPNDGPNAPRNQ